MEKNDPRLFEASEFQTSEKLRNQSQTSFITHIPRYPILVSDKKAPTVIMKINTLLKLEVAFHPFLIASTNKVDPVDSEAIIDTLFFKLSHPWDTEGLIFRHFEFGARIRSHLETPFERSLLKRDFQHKSTVTSCKDMSFIF